VNELPTLRPIEALAESGSLLNRRLWLLLVPIGIDLLIWLAPRVLMGASLLPMEEGNGSGLADQADPENLSVVSIVRQFNVLSLIFGIWVPSLGVSSEGEGPVVILESLPELVLALAIMLPVSCVLGGAYLALIAAEVQQRTLTQTILVPRVLRLAMRLGGLIGLMLVVTVVPFAVATLLLAIVPFLGALLLLLAIFVMFWVAFYVFFIVDSIALVRQDLPKVIRLTVNLIHSNLGSSIGFFFLYWLIVLGTSILWSQMLGWEIASLGIGRIIATIGNAYVGTWVTIALFMYVWNRLLIYRGESGTA
jgi:hypothetical protein